MIVTTKTIEIGRPIQQVWTFLTDPEHLSDWAKDFVRYEPVNLEKNKTQHHYSSSNKAVIVEAEVVDSDEPHRWVQLLNSRDFKADMSYELTSPDDETTHLTLHTQVRVKGILLKLLQPMLKPMVQKRMREEINSLKSAIEKTMDSNAEKTITFSADTATEAAAEREEAPAD